MQYFYHHVPKNLQGTTLYPLSVLKSKIPEIYESEISKYDGRKYVTQQRIPLLRDCLWNEVIFMTTVNPQELFDARAEAGWGKIPPQKYFRIDPSTLDQEKLAVSLFKVKELNAKSGVKADDFVKYSQDDIDKYAILPQATKNYYRYEHEHGQPKIRLFYRYVPHILYKGEIDISNAEIITIV
jgi:hypothetical protein